MLCTTHTVRPYHIANFSYHYSLWISIIPNSTLHLSLPMNNYHFGSKLYSETYSSFVSSHYSYLHNTWNLHYSKLHSTSQTYQSTHTRSQGQHYFEPLNEPKKVKLYPKVHKIHKYIQLPWLKDAELSSLVWFALVAGTGVTALDSSAHCEVFEHLANHQQIHPLSVTPPPFLMSMSSSYLSLQVCNVTLRIKVCNAPFFQSKLLDEFAYDSQVHRALKF